MRAAARGRERFRRPPRRAGGDRAGHRRRPRARVQAGLRPQPVRRRHRPAELGRAQQLARPAAQQPRARAAPIRRARPSSRSWRSPRSRLGKRTPRSRSTTRATSSSAASASATTSRAATAWSTCTSRSWCPPTPTTTSSPTTWASTRSRAFMKQLGFGQRTGIDLNGEAPGILPSPEWKRRASSAPSSRSGTPGETISHRHRPGLQRLHAGAAGAGDGDAWPRTARMYRPHLVAHVDESAHRRAPLRRARAGATMPLKREYGRLRQARHGRASTPKAPARAPSPRRLHQRRQDRHRAGDRHEAEREVRREARSPSATATIRCSSPSRRSTTRSSRMLVIVENGGFGARAAAPIARTVLDYYLLGKLPAAMQARRARRPKTTARATDGAGAATPGSASARAWSRASTARCSS